MPDPQDDLPAAVIEEIEEDPTLDDWTSEFPIIRAGHGRIDSRRWLVLPERYTYKPLRAMAAAREADALAAAPHGRAEHTRLTAWLSRLDVRVLHGRPYHPQTQGKEERFHRTLKAEAIAGRRFDTHAEAQRAFDAWLGRHPDGPIILAALFVLSHLPGRALQGLRLAGGVFLLYLAYGAYRSWRDAAKAETRDAGSPVRNLFQATVVNLTNPNPYLGWSLVMGPLLLKGWREAPAHGIGLLASFYTTIVLAQAGIVLLSAGARKLGHKVSRALVGASAIAFQ